MKKLLLLWCLLLFVKVKTQAQAWHNPLPIDSTTHVVTYTGVVEVPGVKKEELYSRAREWFAVSFRSSKAVLQMDDREAGKLVGRAYAPFGYAANALVTMPSSLWHTIKIEVKDGRYRYTVSDFAMAMNSNNESSARQIEQYFVPKVAYFKNDGRPRQPIESLIQATQATGPGEAKALQAAMQGKSKDF